MPENGARLDRIEAILEVITRRHADLENKVDHLQDGLQDLLTAQVVSTETVGKLAGNMGKLTDTVDKLTGTVDKLTDTVDKVANKVDRLADAQHTTQENLNALIAVVDDIVRRLPPQQQ